MLADGHDALTRQFVVERQTRTTTTCVCLFVSVRLIIINYLLFSSERTIRIRGFSIGEKQKKKKHLIFRCTRPEIVVRIILYYTSYTIMSSTVVPPNVFDKLIGLGVKLIDFYNYLDVQTMFKAFLETMVACACSCFPPMDSFVDDEDDPPSSEQKLVNTTKTRDKAGQFFSCDFEKNSTFFDF